MVRFLVVLLLFQCYECSLEQAWQSSGSSNEGLVNNLFRNALIESERVKEAMLKASLVPYR
jgi:hypothetical protein